MSEPSKTSPEASPRGSAGSGSEAQQGCLYSPLVSLFIAPLVVALVTAYLLQDGRFSPPEQRAGIEQPVLTIVVVAATAPPLPTTAPPDPLFEPAALTPTSAEALPTLEATAALASSTVAPPIPTRALAGLGSAGEVCEAATVAGVTALSIRAAPTRQSERLGEVPAGGAVQVLCDEPIAADERVWLRVRVGQIVGYMSDRYLSLANRPTASDVCGRARVVNVAALAIRAEPTRASAQLGEVAQGELVALLCAEPIAADERVWLRVRAGQVEGYMSDRFLSQETE
jgi:uncharacterized protein YgiM (DUF1202 family)